MLKRKYKKKGFNIHEIHYAKKINSTVNAHNVLGVDLIKVYQASENFNNKLHESQTLHIDLSQKEEDILKGFRPTTRNEIRRNLKRDNVEYFHDTTLNKNKIKTFVENLNTFSQAKRFHKNYQTDTDYLLAQLQDFKENILLTTVSKDNILLAEHLYFCDESRARYMFGISYRLNKNIEIDPNVIGRSNRGLHWFDIQVLKKQGIKIYDLGGIVVNSGDKHLDNVTRFKEGFSKNRVFEYSGNISVSLRGKLGLFIKEFLWH